MNLPGESLTTILTALSDLGSGITWSALGALAAAGTVAMAVVQVVKELSPIRRWFQRCWFERWVDTRAGDFNASVGSMTLTASSGAAAPAAGNAAAAPSGVPVAIVAPAAARQEVVELATGGLAGALYELGAEEMAAQINLAAQIMLDSPVRYRASLAVLSQGVSLDDLATVTRGQPTSGSTQEYFDARGRAGRRIQRNLDGVRIAMGNRWKLWMQLASLLLGTLVIELAVAASGKAGWFTYLVALPVGIVGGYLAPVTRDLLAALQKLRNPR